VAASLKSEKTGQPGSAKTPSPLWGERDGVRGGFKDGTLPPHPPLSPIGGEGESERTP